MICLKRALVRGNLDEIESVRVARKMKKERTKKRGKTKEEKKDKEEEEQEEKEAWENSDPVPDLDTGENYLEEKESPLVESGQSNSLPKHGWTTNVETSTELSAA